MTHQSSTCIDVTSRGTGVIQSGHDEAAEDDDGLRDVDVHTSTEFVGCQAPDDEGEKVDTADDQRHSYWRLCLCQRTRESGFPGKGPSVRPGRRSLDNRQQYSADTLRDLQVE